MIAPNKARPIGRAFFAYSGIDFAALRGDARCCLPREWSHFKAICAAGEPEGQGPPRMRSCIAFGNAFSSRSEWRTIPRASEPQGSPRGQGPPRMGSCIAFGNVFSSRSEWRTIPRASEPQGSPRGQGPPRMRSCIAFGNAPVTPPAPPRRGSHRGSTCRSAAAGNTKRSARSHRST